MGFSPLKAFVFVVAVLALSVAAVHADLIVSLVGAPTFSTGLWTYDYQISNPVGSDPVYDLFLTNVDDATISGTPDGWYTSTAPGSVEWTTYFFQDDYNPVNANSTLPGFTITSPWPVGSGTATVYLNGSIVPDGTVDGPHIPTPEPGSFALVLTSAIGALGFRGIRRARKQRR
jgi:hypothetical protein